jgi:hypothetical protein
MDNTIVDFFKTHGSYVGNVITKDHQHLIGVAHAEIFYNRFNSNQNSITINFLQYANRIDQFTFLANPSLLNNLLFEHVAGNFKISCDISSPNLRSNRMVGRIYELTIEEEFRKFQEGDKYDLDYSYSMPLCALVAGNRMKTSHNHLGSFYGLFKEEYNWGEEQSLIQWSNNVFEFFIQNTKILLFEELENIEQDTDEVGHPSLIQIKATKLAISAREVTSQYSPEMDNSIRTIANAVMLCLSFLERNRFHWRYEKISITQAGDNPIVRYKKRETFRHIPKYKESSFTGSRAFMRMNEMKALVQPITEKILLLSPENRDQFIKLFDYFQLAFTAPYLEMELVFLASCLDLLLTNLGFEKGPYSVRVINGSKAAGIEYVDLFPSPSEEEILMSINGRRTNKSTKEKKFRFVEIRNEYLHRGFGNIDGYEVIKESEQLALLVERFILKFLDIDYRGTPMGFAIPHGSITVTPAPAESPAI